MDQYEDESHISNEMLLLELKHKKPTVMWLKRYLDGFEVISQWALLESEVIFDEYIYGLLKIENTSEAEIIKCIDKAIDRFNRIGGSPQAKYGAFIETVEREEIMSFLEQAAEMAGLKIEHSIDDISNVIREW